MDALDRNIFELYKEKWWVTKQTFNNTKKNVVIKTCQTFMNRLKKKPICIGAGSYGQAWIIQFDGKPKEFVQKIYTRLEESTTIEILSEVNALAYFNCEYTPKLTYSGFTFEEEKYGTINEKWCIIMEYFKGGTIADHLDNRTIITPEGKKFIAYELALALEYLHGKNYTHGDVKPDNIALTENGHVRLIDFGHSRNVEKKTILPPTAINYMAPEVFRGDEAGVSSDRWSYGNVLCVLIQRASPFGIVGQSGQEIYNETMNKKPYLDKINDDDAKDLISKLVNPDPSQRYAGITKHAYFKNVTKDDDPPFKPGIMKLELIDDLENGDWCLTEDEVYATLMKEALKIPTIAYLESIENQTIVNKEIKNLQTCAILKKVSNEKEKNIQVDDGKLTKSKDGVKTPAAAGKATKPKGGGNGNNKAKKRINKKQAKNGNKKAK